MTSCRNEESAQRALPAVTYSSFGRHPKVLAKAGQSRPKAGVGVGRLFLAKSRLLSAEEEPASAGFSRLPSVAPKGNGRAGKAGVSRLFWPKKPAQSRCKPAFLAKAGSFPAKRGP